MVTKIDEKTALILIDLQKGIVKEQLAHPVNKVITNAALLKEGFGNAGLPVVVVTVNPFGAAWTKARVEQPSLPKWIILQTLAKAALAVTGFTDIAQGIKTNGTDIFITKKNWDAFYETDLHKRLQQLGVTGIVLAGIATSIGVEGTARTASALGYNITFATDAMTDKHIEAHQHSVTYIFPRIGENGTALTIIDKIKKQQLHKV